jgi:hypothetical protein
MYPVRMIHSARAYASWRSCRDAKVTLCRTVCNWTSSVVVGVPSLDVRLARRLVGDPDFVPCGAARAGCRERVCQCARGCVSTLCALDSIGPWMDDYNLGMGLPAFVHTLTPATCYRPEDSLITHCLRPSVFLPLSNVNVPEHFAKLLILAKKGRFLLKILLYIQSTVRATLNFIQLS